MSEDKEHKPCPLKDTCKYYFESPRCDEDEGYMWGHECGILKNKLKYHLFEM